MMMKQLVSSYVGSLWVVFFIWITFLGFLCVCAYQVKGTCSTCICEEDLQVYFYLRSILLCVNLIWNYFFSWSDHPDFHKCWKKFTVRTSKYLHVSILSEIKYPFLLLCTMRNGKSLNLFLDLFFSVILVWNHLIIKLFSLTLTLKFLF